MKIHMIKVRYPIHQNVCPAFFDDKNGKVISPTEHASSKKNAKKLHLNIHPPKNHAHCISYTPGLLPWPLSAEREAEILSDALSAGIRLSHLLRGNGLSEAMTSVFDNPKVLLFIPEDNDWKVATTVVPDVRFTYPTPRFTDAALQADIQNLLKKEVWQCGIMYVPTYVGEPDGPERPHNMFVLLAISEKDFQPHVFHTCSSQDAPETIAAGMAEYLLNENCCPKTLRCRDTRSYRLLQDFCNRTGIHIERKGDTSLIIQLQKDYYEHLLAHAQELDSGEFSLYDDDDETAEALTHAIDQFSTFSDRELRSLPTHVRTALLSLSLRPDFPPRFRQRLSHLFPNG